MKPNKCIGVKVKSIPINVTTQWYLEIELVDVQREPWIPDESSSWSWKNIIPEKIAITVPKDNTKWKWVTT